MTTIETDAEWREFAANAYQLKAQKEPDELKRAKYLARVEEIRGAE